MKVFPSADQFVEGFSHRLIGNISIPTQLPFSRSHSHALELIKLKKKFLFPPKFFCNLFAMGKVVHRSYASKRKALERIKAKRRERRKEIREPLSRHDKNGKLWFGGGAVPMDMACA